MGRRGRNNFINERLFFITTTVVNFTPIFKHACFCDILINDFKFYKQKYAFKILAYVIMPSHFHWIIFTDPETGTVSDIMRDIKKSSARQIFDLPDNGKLELYNRIFEKAAQGIEDQNRKFWKKRFDDEIIRNKDMFRTKIAYVHNNPVKAGLYDKPEDFYYSSAKNYKLGCNSGLLVDTDWADVHFCGN
jgi:REP element-mobilizing transposase RayT